VVVNVVSQALEHIFSGEPVILDLMHNLIIDLQIVIMLIIEVMPLFLCLRAVLPNQVLVHHIILRYNLLLQPCVLILLPLLLLLRTQVALAALVVRVLVVHTVVEVLVVELLILTVKLADSRIEADSHIFVNK